MGRIEMILIDTHVLIWWVTGSSKLSKNAKKSIEKNHKSGKIYVSAITFWEIALLVKKKRLKLSMDLNLWIKKVLSISSLGVVSINHKIAMNSVFLKGFNNPDPADRFIVVSAQNLNVSLVTADEKIRKFNGIETIW